MRGGLLLEFDTGGGWGSEELKRFGSFWSESIKGAGEFRYFAGAVR